jgi:hypothetical protein
METGRFVAGKGQFRAWQNADGDAGIFRRAKASRSSAEVACGEAVANFGGPRTDILKAVVAHGANLQFSGSPISQTVTNLFGFAAPARFAQ